MPEVRAQIVISAKDEASANLKKVGDTGAKLGKDLNKGLSDGIQAATGLNVASLSLAGGIAALGAGFAYAVGQAAEAEKIMAQTEAVVKSTGMAAGLTAEQIGSMSGRLSQLSAVDDEVIQSGANLLLTFKAVKSDAFEPAMQAALDMSTAMGTDLKGSVIQVGKALEDPIRGLAALRRSGVSFTADQQAVIKALVNTGKSAEAQKLILEELNKQFGGSAAASAKTYTGQLALLKINTDNLAQAIGEKLLPPLTKATAALNLLITWSDKLNVAFEEQRANLEQTAASYDDYRNYLLDAAVKSGKLLQVQADQIKLMQSGQPMMALTIKQTQQWADGVGLLSEAEFDANKATVAVTESSEAYTNQLQSQTQWLEDTASASAGVAASTYEVEKAQLRLNKALEAGLAGTLTQAQDDYRAVLAETTPEIARLTAEITRYEQAQGKTWTVTTAATTSIEEYELAQIKAAEAAVKLAEFTGDNREEYLNLKIAADNAAEKVGALGETMGISTTYTADYTTKLAENHAALAELKLKNDEAAAAMKLATAEFLNQQLAASLTEEGQRRLAVELGLMSEADYLAATAAQNLTKMLDGTRASEELMIGATGTLRDTINSLQSRNIDINISTFYHEYRIQSGAAPSGHEGDTGQAGDGSYGNTTPTTPDPSRDNRARGGDFIVPPGYPNDSYRMGVQSGEHVQVTPAGGGGGTDPADILALLPGMIGRELSSALMRWGGRL